MNGETSQPDGRLASSIALGQGLTGANEPPQSTLPHEASVTLPTGGGAIRGIGERFAANPVTGTGAMTVPVATSPGRSGFGPQLALSYDSGYGNGPFGLGWSLAAGSVHRKTDRGLPRYRPAPEDDVFALAGADDLVPEPAPQPPPTPWGGQTYARTRFRPRTEGAYAQIELWQNLADDADTCWRVVSRDNVTSWYGLEAEARIHDPADPDHVYEWLLSVIYDDKGNVATYGYKREDSTGVDLTAAHERNRTPLGRSANRYLKRIRYGNRTPFYAVLDPKERQPLPEDWLFEVVFDYGEHDQATPTTSESSPWNIRPDPFSSCRPGFEVRTYRRCRRVLVFHHFAEIAAIGNDCLVRSTDFAYADELEPARDPAGFSYLSAVTSRGYLRGGAGYTVKSLPPVEMSYSRADIDATIHEVAPEDRSGLPEGVDGERYRWVDLDGEAVRGVLAAQSGCWRYSRNVSPSRRSEREGAVPVAAFAPATELATLPSSATLADGLLLTDLDGDGRLELADLAGSTPGFYARSTASGWGDFTALKATPCLEWSDPAVRLADVTGNGRADIVVFGDETVEWYPSLGSDGFAQIERVVHGDDEERGPRVIFEDAGELVALADLTGDGLLDLARIRASEICYWPNLGYGRFGARVTMDDAPILDATEEFDPRRVLLLDVDGTGAVDLVHLGRERVDVHFNCSGNRWSEAQPIATVGGVADPATVTGTDLLGSGTSCLVLSSPLPADSDHPLRFIDLMAEGKPHLLTRIVNNLGAETRVTYSTSTQFAQEDALAGRPWITRLPFPVHVVASSEMLDHVAGTRLRTRYTYHHGAYDGVEREFRGFAMVERHDTDIFGETDAEGAGQDLSPEHQQPPVTTRTWFHTGELDAEGGAGEPLSREYYDGGQLLESPAVPADVAPEELAECVRALRGVALRQEIYSFDGSPQQALPYSIAEHRYAVRRLVARNGPYPGVFATDGVESLSLSLEREPSDPRVAHSFNIELDEYGHAVKSASVNYGRTAPDPTLPHEVQAAQGALTIAYAEADYTGDIDIDGPQPAYRVRVPYETRGYEITGVTPAAPRFTTTELAAAIAAAAPIEFATVADGSAQRRLLARHRTLFLDDALAPLAKGRWDTLGLAYQSYSLAHTPGTLAAYPAGDVTTAQLEAAGFVEPDGDGNWWSPTGTVTFDPDARAHFYLATGARDQLGLETKHAYDPYDLLVKSVSVVQAPWSVTSAENDYRVLGPVLKTDPNGNRSAVVLDELGMLTAQVTMGKQGSADGDTLASPTVRFEYDLDAWRTHGTPCSVHILSREEQGDPNTRWQERYVYANGAGGVALTKLRVAPGLAPQLNPDGSIGEIAADPRWLGSGRVVVNNKGLPIRRYDPYFSPSSEYEQETAIRSLGVSPTLHYDPAGRVILTEFPEGTSARVTYETWRQQAFDANDTVLESRWYTERGSPDPQHEPEPLGDPQRRAAWLAAQHANTPGTTYFDAQGRAIYVVSDYGGGKTAAVRLEVDYGGRFTTVYDQLGRAVSGGFTGPAGAIYGDSAERGRRYAFNDVRGAIVRVWDEHGRQLRAEYDELHRPASVFARASAADPELLFSHVVYGDRAADALANNLNGTPHLVFDQAGVIRVPSLDFRGNPTRVERRLATIYQHALDWAAVAAAASVAEVEAAAGPLLEADVYAVSATVDALGRPTRVTLPDATVVSSTYDIGGKLATLNALPAGVGAPLPVLVEQDYDALGRRKVARHGNGLQTTYEYDPLSERLTQLTTAQPGADPSTAALRRLSYAYDPVGNVVSTADAAQQTLFFSNAVVTPERLYSYDAIYQLIGAAGREHAGLPNDSMLTGADFQPIAQLPNANDASAVRRYTESYEYDLVGNITSLSHRYQAQPGVGAGWSRTYHYAYQDTPADRTNRLLSTSVDGGVTTERYEHDAYGNMTQLPNLPALAWNALDQLQSVSLGGGGDAYYVYGAGGQRVRRVVERPGGLTIEEVQLGPYEIRREHSGAGETQLEHRVVHIADDAGQIAQIETKTIDVAGSEPANAIGAPLLSFRYSDSHASAMLYTDAAGATISYEEFHPWGTSAYRLSKPGVNLSLKQYRFSGKHRDEETGLYAFGARYYAAWLGRWTSADPAGTSAGSNLYRYCANDPVGRGDPSGMEDKPLSPLGKVSWEVPQSVFMRGGKRLSDAQAMSNFERWLARAHPDRAYTPGSVTVDWSTMGGRRGPTFNAEWLDNKGQPLLPREGEFGWVAPKNKQPPADYADPANRTGRTTENEHNTPGAQQRAVDPTYTDSDYERDPTTRNPYGVARDKTRGDNAATRAIQQQVSNNQPVDVTDMDMASRDRFQAANERARAAGDPHIRNPGSIDRGTLEQMGTRFGRTRAGRQTLPAGDQIEEPDIQPTANPPTTPADSPDAAPPPSYSGGALRFAGGAMNAGGNFALQATRTFVPGVAEAEIAFTTGAMYAYSWSAATATTSATLSVGLASAGGALTTAAAYTPVVGGSLIAGAVGGNAAESLAASVTSDKDVQLAAGVIGAAATGAAVGALIGSVVPIAGTVIGAGAGAAVGAVAGLAGYLISKFW